MKKTTINFLSLLFLITICFTSCKSDKEFISQNSEENRDMIIQAKLENSMKSKLQYPESYKFTQLKLRDSVLYSDNIKDIKQSYQRILDGNKSSLERQEAYKNEGSSKFSKVSVAELQSAIAKNEKILVEIDKISSDLGNKINQAASYTYEYAFNSKNISGNDASYDYIVQTSSAPDYKLLNMTDKEEMLIKTPNDFPGYKEMLTTLK
ncbi:hypothetical protein BZARG_1760 [Bizionia argentinensis JUB59]|uniref:Lipoprotein n=1 Tax=Bizionia argentinensis JUB59 TaxID=1046627 RepID=G2EDU4_9FLAO|nr:hypothetical protein [Bizionia argentinensis]EGV43351.2 hypothetical protein BZARG_1760 [Bizionia argentinensis JUB59]